MIKSSEVKAETRPSREFVRLLEMFNRAQNGSHTDLQDDELLEAVACDWLNHECESHGVDHFRLNQTGDRQPWYRNFPVTRNNHLI